MGDSDVSVVVTWPQTEESSGPPGKGRKDPLLQPPEGAQLADTSIWASSLQNWERTHFCGFKPPSLW